jgi:hypothetical protein
MPDVLSAIALSGGLLTFGMSLLYLHEYLKFRKETAGLFRWNPDPRTPRGETLSKDGRPIAVVEGPKGRAEIYEVGVTGSVEYQIRHNGRLQTRKSLNEAYITAGESVRDSA